MTQVAAIIMQMIPETDFASFFGQTPFLVYIYAVFHCRLKI